jgi:hypothetical protein
MAARAKHGRAPDWLAGTPSPLQFFSKLKWIDGRSLLDTIEPYRREIFDSVLWTFDGDGRPQINLALEGRGKKNFKTADLDLAGAYRFFVWPSPHGNDCYVVCSDEDQAADNLDLFKKILAVNPVLSRAVEIRVKELVRLDGNGRFRILPRDIDGLHGKGFLFAGFDEIHTMPNHDVLEALAPDPSRHDALVWCTSYAGIRHTRGIPLHDMMEAGKAGADPRMHFSWYSGSFTTDPRLAGDDVTPEQRANPSMASWGNDGYLAQQKARLPNHKFRRLHLNEPAGVDGAALDGDAIIAAVVPGRRQIPHDPELTYIAATDMSGGSSDNACLCISHQDPETGRTVMDVLTSQGGAPPFDPRAAVGKFAEIAKSYGCYVIHGDSYGGRTFMADFEARGVAYRPILQTKHILYEALEAPLLAKELEWLDVPELVEEALTLTYRGTKIDHLPGAHDDFVNVAAIACFVARQREPEIPIICPFVVDNTTAPTFDRWSPNWSGFVAPSGAEDTRDYTTGTHAWTRRKMADRGNQ